MIRCLKNRKGWVRNSSQEGYRPVSFESFTTNFVLSRGASNVETEELRSRLRVFQAQVAYSVGRGQVPKEVKDFLDLSLEKILSGPDLAGELGEFVQFLESVYGYYYYHENS